MGGRRDLSEVIMSGKSDLEKELEKLKRQLQLEKCKTTRLKNSIQKKLDKTKQKAEREKEKLKEALVSAIIYRGAWGTPFVKSMALPE